VDKAIEAAISAIEIYNKPSFRYREESYSILMLNAWELLLKARILKENKNKIRSIQVFERKINKSGLPSKYPRPKLNRSKNEMTIGLPTAIKLVQGYNKDAIDQYCAENISLLMEIRDNAIHFQNPSKSLRKRAQEIGSAALRNFAHAAKNWFQRDLSKYDFALMPFAFESPMGVIQTVFGDDQKGPQGKLQRLLADTEKQFPFDPTKPFNVGVAVELRFVRKAVETAIPVKLAAPGDAAAVPVTISEEEIRRRYAWTYTELTSEVRKRYSNLKVDAQFHATRRQLEKDTRYCIVRQLDPRNAKSAKQKFYDPNILNELDKSYKRR
jgi:Protein of unknown function (DUF3644)